jgi:hypothetical protein
MQQSGFGEENELSKREEEECGEEEECEETEPNREE